MRTGDDQYVVGVEGVDTVDGPLSGRHRLHGTHDLPPVRRRLSTWGHSRPALLGSLFEGFSRREEGPARRPLVPSRCPGGPKGNFGNSFRGETSETPLFRWRLVVSVRRTLRTVTTHPTLWAERGRDEGNTWTRTVGTGRRKCLDDPPVVLRGPLLPATMRPFPVRLHSSRTPGASRRHVTTFLLRRPVHPQPGRVHLRSSGGRGVLLGPDAKKVSMDGTRS